MTIPLLYEDADFIAIDKPKGIASIPERDKTRETVLSLLESQVGQKLFIVHRLDKEVTGVMLFAKTAPMHKYLNEEFFNRSVQKTYRAIVHGAIIDETGIIDKPIRQFGSGRMGIDMVKGKPSVTRYTVIERNILGTVLHAFPKTGRRHQIRVHFYSIGHPIVGDPLYGDKELQKQTPGLLLHAEKIEFKKMDGGEIEITADIPEEFRVKQ